MISHQALALFAHHAVFLLRTCHDALNGVVDLVHGDLAELTASSQDGGLIQQIGQVGASEARGAPGHFVEINVFRQGLAAGVNAKYLETTAVIRAIHHHLTVKATRTHQGLIQHVGAVGGRNDDDSGVAFKTIHLRQELVQGLLTLVVAAAKAGAALATDRINLIDKDDARRVFLGLLEQIANAAGTHTNKHLDEFRTGDREEGNASFTSDSFGQQGFAGTRRAHQKHAFGDLGANGGKAIGVLEEVDNLGELELGAFNASDIFKGHLGLGFHLNPRFALAEAHSGVATTTLGAAQQEEQSTEQQQGEEQAAQGRLPRRRLAAGLHVDVDVVLAEQIQQVLVGSQVHLGALAIALNSQCSAPIRSNQHLGDFVALNGLNEVAVAEVDRCVVGCVGAPADKGCAEGDQHHHQQDIQPRVAPTLLCGQGSTPRDYGMLTAVAR